MGPFLFAECLGRARGVACEEDVLGLLLAFFIFVASALLSQKTRPKTEPPEVHVGAKVRILGRRGFGYLRKGHMKLVAGPANISGRLVSAVSVLRRTPGIGLMTLCNPRRNMQNSMRTNSGMSGTGSSDAKLPICSLCNGAHGPAPRVLGSVSILMCSVRSVNYHSFACVDAVKMTVRTTTRGGGRFVILSHPGPVNKLGVRKGIMRSKCVSFIDRFGVPCLCKLAYNRLTLVLGNRRVLDGPYGLRIIGVGN